MEANMYTGPHAPLQPRVGDLYLNTTTNQVMIFTGGEWWKMYPEEANLSPIDKTMMKFARKVNKQENSNRRMVWHTGKDSGKNIPAYWLGVVYAAYREKLIDTSEFTDIMIALHPLMAKSSYYQELLERLKNNTL